MVGLRQVIAKLVILRWIPYKRSYFGNILSDIGDLPHLIDEEKFVDLVNILFCA